MAIHHARATSRLSTRDPYFGDDLVQNPQHSIRKLATRINPLDPEDSEKAVGGKGTGCELVRVTPVLPPRDPKRRLIRLAV